MKKLEDFIERAKQVHGDKYDYSLIEEIKNLNQKVNIYCKKHGLFEQKAMHHLNGHGCAKCAYDKIQKDRLISLEDFIQRAKQVHGDKYDYSKVDYKGSQKKVIIICNKIDKSGKIHGEFEQVSSSHIYGKSGCPKCALENRKPVLNFRNKRILFRDNFIERAKIVHGDKYDYSIVEDFKTSREKVSIICLKHGIFRQNISNHLNGQGCPLCAKEKSFMTLEEFIQKAKQVHNNKYDYSKVIYVNNLTKVCIICSEHGEFWQTPNSHLNGQGCPNCNISKGEEKIKKFLKKVNIKFEVQYKFPDCLGKRNILLPFDFYILDKNICIEYDGQQHFKPTCFGGMSLDKAIKNFEIVQKNDKIKNEYCERNDINLIRIPYWKKNEIEEILKMEVING